MSLDLSNAVEPWPVGWSAGDEVRLHEECRTVTYTGCLQPLMGNDVLFGNSVTVRSNVVVPSEESVVNAMRVAASATSKGGSGAGVEVGVHFHAMVKTAMGSLRNLIGSASSSSPRPLPGAPAGSETDKSTADPFDPLSLALPVSAHIAGSVSRTPRPATAGLVTMATQTEPSSTALDPAAIAHAVERGTDCDGVREAMKGLGADKRPTVTAAAVVGADAHEVSASTMSPHTADVRVGEVMGVASGGPILSSPIARGVRADASDSGTENSAQKSPAARQPAAGSVCAMDQSTSVSAGSESSSEGLSFSSSSSSGNDISWGAAAVQQRKKRRRKRRQRAHSSPRKARVQSVAAEMEAIADLADDLGIEYEPDPEAEEAELMERAKHEQQRKTDRDRRRARRRARRARRAVRAAAAAARDAAEEATARAEAAASASAAAVVAAAELAKEMERLARQPPAEVRALPAGALDESGWQVSRRSVDGDALCDVDIGTDSADEADDQDESVREQRALPAGALAATAAPFTRSSDYSYDDTPHDDVIDTGSVFECTLQHRAGQGLGFNLQSVQKASLPYRAFSRATTMIDVDNPFYANINDGCAGPAEASAMIEAGDELLAVNGLDVSKMPFDAVVEELQAITVNRKSSGAAADDVFKYTTLRFARNGHVRRRQEAVRRASGQESDRMRVRNHLVDVDASSTFSTDAAPRALLEDVPTYYVEVRIDATGGPTMHGGVIAIGLCPAVNDVIDSKGTRPSALTAETSGAAAHRGVTAGSMPGWEEGSFGLHSDGELYSGDKPGRGRRYTDPFGKGDIVGCGWELSTGRVFFTLNGNTLGTAWVGIRPKDQRYYIAVGMDTVGAQLTANFGAGMGNKSPSPDFEYDAVPRLRPRSGGSFGGKLNVARHGIGFDTATNVVQQAPGAATATVTIDASARNTANSDDKTSSNRRAEAKAQPSAEALSSTVNHERGGVTGKLSAWADSAKEFLPFGARRPALDGAEEITSSASNPPHVDEGVPSQPGNSSLMSEDNSRQTIDASTSTADMADALRVSAREQQLARMLADADIDSLIINARAVDRQRKMNAAIALAHFAGSSRAHCRRVVGSGGLNALVWLALGADRRHRNANESNSDTAGGRGTAASSYGSELEWQASQAVVALVANSCARPSRLFVSESAGLLVCFKMLAEHHKADLNTRHEVSRALAQLSRAVDDVWASGGDVRGVYEAMVPLVMQLTKLQAVMYRKTQRPTATDKATHQSGKAAVDAGSDTTDAESWCLVRTLPDCSATVEERTRVFLARTMSNLARCEEARTLLLEHGALKPITAWLDLAISDAQATIECRTTNVTKTPNTASGSPVEVDVEQSVPEQSVSQVLIQKSLRRYVSRTIACFSSRPAQIRGSIGGNSELPPGSPEMGRGRWRERPAEAAISPYSRSNGLSENSSFGDDPYAQGWIDARLVAGGVLERVIALGNAVTELDESDSDIPEDRNVLLADYATREHVSATLTNLSDPSKHNRVAIVEAGGIETLVRLAQPCRDRAASRLVSEPGSPPAPPPLSPPNPVTPGDSASETAADKVLARLLDGNVPKVQEVSQLDVTTDDRDSIFVGQDYVGDDDIFDDCSDATRSSSSSLAAQNAVAAIAHLIMGNGESIRRAINAGALLPIVSLAQASSPDTRLPALRAISYVSESVRAADKEALVGAGGLRALLDLSPGFATGRADTDATRNIEEQFRVTYALANLADATAVVRAEMLLAGAVPALVGFANDCSLQRPGRSRSRTTSSGSYSRTRSVGSISSYDQDEDDVEREKVEGKKTQVLHQAVKALALLAVFDAGRHDGTEFTDLNIVPSTPPTPTEGDTAESLSSRAESGHEARRQSWRDKVRRWSRGLGNKAERCDITSNQDAGLERSEAQHVMRWLGVQASRSCSRPGEAGADINTVICPADTATDANGPPSVISVQTRAKEDSVGSNGGALDLFLHHLDSPNVLVQTQVLIGLAALCRWQTLRAHVADAIPELFGLVRGSMNRAGDPRLRPHVDSVFVALGFAGGADDVASACNDAGTMSDWYHMGASLFRQRTLELTLSPLVSAPWVLPKSDEANAVARAMEQMAEDTAADTTSMASAGAERAFATAVTSKLLAVVGVANDRNNSDTSTDDVVAAAADGHLPPLLLHQLLQLYPSQLRQQQVLSLMRQARVLSPSSSSLQSHVPHVGDIMPSLSPEKDATKSESSEVLPIARVLEMPRGRTFFAFRFGAVIAKLLARHDPHNAACWDLAFRDVSFEGESCAQLAECLRSFPSVRALTFSQTPAAHHTGIGSVARGVGSAVGSAVGVKPSGSGQGLGAAFAYVIEQLPPWITWLTFDRALTPEGVRVVAILLRRSLVSRDHDKQMPTSHASGSIRGLAIRNHGISGGIGLREAELTPIVDLVRAHSVLRERQGASTVNVCWLDLSGNKLGDAGAAAIARAGAEHPRLQALDLSRNEIGRGTAFAEALKGPDGLLSNASRLSALHLGNNKLDERAVRSILKSVMDLCKDDRNTLRVLDLRDNMLILAPSPPSQPYGPLADLVRAAGGVVDIDVSNNRLAEAAGRELQFAVLENQDLCFLRLHGNTQLRAEDVSFVRQRLAENRSRYATGSGTGIGDSAGRSGCQQLGAGYCASPPSLSRAQSNDINCDSVCSLPDTHIDDNKALPEGNSDKSDISLEKRQAQAHAQAQAQARARGNRPTLCVLFSAPLAWRDRRGRLQPMEVLDFDVERDLLRETLREAGRDIHLRFDFATTGCRAIHYSGHGSPDCLSFEDGMGGLHIVQADTLRRLCAAGRGRGRARSKVDKLEKQATIADIASDTGCHGVHFVFVSACYSRHAGEAFVAAGVPHVICARVDAQLQDTAALAFTQAVYLSLAVGDTVREAFEIGLQAVSSAPNIQSAEREMDKFVLLPAVGDTLEGVEGEPNTVVGECHHDVPIFEHAAMLQFGADGMSADPIAGSYGCNSLSGASTGFRSLHFSPLSENTSIPSVPQDFLGRNVDMYRVLVDVLKRRLVTITGDNGIGKTTLAIAISNYVAERRYSLSDGVVFVRAEGLKSVRQLVHATIMAMPEATVQASATARASNSAGAGTGRAAEAGKQRSDVLPSDSADDVARRRLIQCLRHRRCLLVWDNCDGVLQDPLYKFTVGELLDQTKGVRLLITSTSPVGGVPGFGENLLQLGPLNVRDSARLLTRLCQHCRTPAERRRVQAALLESEVRRATAAISIESGPTMKHGAGVDVETHSEHVRKLQRARSVALSAPGGVGGGHPALIQAAAYGMSRADVEVLLRTQAHASPAHVDRREAAAATSTDSATSSSNPGRVSGAIESRTEPGLVGATETATEAETQAEVHTESGATPLHDSGADEEHKSSDDNHMAQLPA
eukprot:g986.t1